MPRSDLHDVCVTAAAVGLAVLALVGCQGGLTVTEAPERSIRADSRRGGEAADAGAREVDERASASDGSAGRDPLRDREVPAREGAGEAAPVDERARERDGERKSDGGSDDRSTEEERAEADADDSLQVHAVQSVDADLEFSEGLPEPPQQQLAPSPAPWTPPSGADASGEPVIEDVWPDKGPASGGERVVIRGRNLAPAQVVFGLVPARILGVGEAQDALTVVAPASDAGQVGVVVTNRDGSYAVAERPFRYYR